MKLYSFHYSPFVQKVRAVLDLLGRHYTVMEVAYGDRTELATLTGGYIHVPVLAEDDGRVVCDSRRICEHLLSDAAAAGDWPIARDVVDYLGEEPVDEDEDEEEGEPIGDLGIVADLGLNDFDMGAIIDNLDLSSVEMLVEVADKIKLNPQFRKAVEAAVG